jgi:hypothetical protein
MCTSRWVEVGVSNAPIAMPIQSRAGGSKNKEDPQVEQNPRRTFADEWYQLKFFRPLIATADLGTSVDAK